MLKVCVKNFGRKEGRAMITISGAAIIICFSLVLPTMLVQCFSSSNSISKSNLISVSQELKMLEMLQQIRSSRVTSSLWIPPWIFRYENIGKDSLDEKVQWLKGALLDQGFSSLDIREILATVGRVSGEDSSLMAGIMDMLQLILRLEKKSFETVVFNSREVLMASAIHYAECVRALNTRVQDQVGNAFFLGNSTNDSLQASSNYSIPKADITNVDEIAITLPSSKNNDASHSSEEEVSRITLGASRIKEVEIMARLVLGARSSYSKEESVKLRSLLLSYTDDWRSLGIRVVACQFRLESIILASAEKGANSYFRSPEEVRNAREALRVFAPLAQQLGMQHLKAEIEDCAFRILYRRQYKAATTLYYQHDHSVSMEEMSKFLKADITRLLLSDEKLVNELEDIQISSRVKEMFSSWKKIVRKRFKRVAALKRLPKGTSHEWTSLSKLRNPGLSLTELKDGVALRVVLRARKYTEFESDEITRAREQLLCYYTQHLIRDKWPVLSPETVKDYIQYPKANGYQSLHHTSFISIADKEWPFEIQVRSDEMHRIAEYGVAAHWDYKFGKQNDLALTRGEIIPKPVRIKSDGGQEVDVPMPQLPPPEESYIDALVTAKEQIIQNKIFVFFVGNESVNNERQLMSLPVGAKVYDAVNQLEEILESEVEYRVLMNGVEASLDSVVQNGDVLFVTLD